MGSPAYRRTGLGLTRIQIFRFFRAEATPVDSCSFPSWDIFSCWSAFSAFSSFAGGAGAGSTSGSGAFTSGVAFPRSKTCPALVVSSLVSLTSLLYALKFGFKDEPTRRYPRLSLVVTVAPSWRTRSKKIGSSKGLAEDVPSAMM